MVNSLGSFLGSYWQDALFLFILGVGGWIVRFVRKKLITMIKRQDAIEEGVLALLHYRLYTECERFIEAGEITKDDLLNIEHLYEAYHALGGNGTGTELYNRVRKLKIKT